MKLYYDRFNFVDFYIHKKFELHVNEYLSVPVSLKGSCRPKRKVNVKVIQI